MPHQMLAAAPILNRTFQPCTHTRRDRTIIVIRNAGASLGGNPASNAREVAEYAARGLRFALVVLNDENLKHPCGQQNCTDEEAAALDKLPSYGGKNNHPCFSTWRNIKKIFAKAPLVVRNYHHPECAGLPNVQTVPVGIQSGQLQPARARRHHLRRYAWTFSSGHSTHLRSAMVEALLREQRLAPFALAYPLKASKLVNAASTHVASMAVPSSLPINGASMPPARPAAPDSSLVIETGDGQAFGKPMANYTVVLCDASFALCPTGNHIETWRLMEALDCGAIPIIASEQAAYYEELMPSVARHFIVLDVTCAASKRYTRKTAPCFPRTPHNTTSALAELVANPDALQQRRAALAAAYEAHRRAYRQEVARGLGALETEKPTLAIL